MARIIKKQSTIAKIPKCSGESILPNSLVNTYSSTPGFEPGPHWWEVSALTTAPSLQILFENHGENNIEKCIY